MQLHLLTIFLPAALCASKCWNRFSPKFYPHSVPNPHKAIVLDFNVLIPEHRNFMLKLSQRRAMNAYAGKILEETDGHIEYLRHEYATKYFSFASALVAEKGIDPHDLDNYVCENTDYHDIPTNEALFDTLKKLNSKIVVLSDESIKYTEKVLAQLGIMPLVNIIFAATPGESNLPLKELSITEGFSQVDRFINVDPRFVTYVAVSLHNLYMAKGREWNLIGVDSDSNKFNDAYPKIRIGSIYELPYFLKPITPEQE